MTNKELIERFFAKRLDHDGESYGFSINCLSYPEFSKLVLYSKTNPHPIAISEAEDLFVIATTNLGFALNSGSETHRKFVIATAGRLRIKYVLSPNADKAEFQKHMERKINNALIILARDLRTGSYSSVYRLIRTDKPKPKYIYDTESKTCYSAPKNYLILMKNIQTLLNGEVLLGLSKNQVALMDTEEVQSLWKWLIKDNPYKKDRELLQKIYILNRLLGRAFSKKT